MKSTIYIVYRTPYGKSYYEADNYDTGTWRPNLDVIDWFFDESEAIAECKKQD